MTEHSVHKELVEGCIRVKDALIWNRFGFLVLSCHHCSDRQCLNHPEAKEVLEAFFDYVKS